MRFEKVIQNTHCTNSKHFNTTVKIHKIVQYEVFNIVEVNRRCIVPLVESTLLGLRPPGRRQAHWTLRVSICSAFVNSLAVSFTLPTPPSQVALLPEAAIGDLSLQWGRRS